MAYLERSRGAYHLLLPPPFPPPARPLSCPPGLEGWVWGASLEGDLEGLEGELGGQACYQLGGLKGKREGLEGEVGVGLEDFRVRSAGWGRAWRANLEASKVRLEGCVASFSGKTILQSKTET